MFLMYLSISFFFSISLVVCLSKSSWIWAFLIENIVPWVINIPACFFSVIPCVTSWYMTIYRFLLHVRWIPLLLVHNINTTCDTAWKMSYYISIHQRSHIHSNSMCGYKTYCSTGHYLYLHLFRNSNLILCRC